MSKTTKVIAALGVVAGLGVAALPAFTYAAQVAGEVQIDVEVPDAIAMTIAGNNDTTLGGVNVYDPVATVDTHTGGEAYDPTDLQTSGSKTSILPNAAKTDDTTFKSTITVYTNGVGYSLTLIDDDTNTSLVNDTNTIPAVNTVDSDSDGNGDNAIVAGTAAWGYKVGSSASTWLAVPASNGTAASIKANGAYAAGGETTEVYYAVSTSPTQAQGTYTDTIIYTATSANN
ncbi:hypothetical protein IJG78_02820 [Candidatus Saccharibacteria bacterium]|nr:hypothetical protein [Candidatus Saccharibacteria bacterium]MBQ3309585.1 hypothetical protein [Candidatus Saccharibacteria bacterium]